jgi:Type I phosphodiesterase / nucleotide pyrophosphatase
VKSRRLALLLSLALLAGSVAAARLPSAAAQEGGGCPCVVLIEVDGLEPKDIRPELTPVLWEMSHPQGGQIWGGSGRAGWTWQAPRASMAASTASNAAALLTGGYAEQTGVPGDEFMADGGMVRMQAQEQENIKRLDEGDLFAESLLDLVPGGTDDQKASAAFVGNPALGGLIGANGDADPLRWAPANDDAQNPPSPAYCDIPREAPSSPDAGFQPACSATDMVTLNKAVTELNAAAKAPKVAFTYIHLAELGVVKRSEGDTAGPSEDPNSESGQGVPHALAQLDAALGTFVTRYRDSARAPITAAKFPGTFFMLTGNHGYDATPQNNRVPSGDGESADLETYVESNGRLEFVPQGSLGVVYATDRELTRRREALQGLRTKLRNGGDVENACVSAGAAPADGPDERGGCIKEILYMRENLLPAGVTDAEKKKLLLPLAHPSWRLDHIKTDDDGTVVGPTGISGEMVIVTERGWATGRSVAHPDENAEGVPVNEPVNPYTGSAGGPRARAVAAIVNGPAGGNGSRQVTGPHYPVTKGSDDPDEVEFDETPEPAHPTIDAANDAPGDDANATGHERQPETVDFAPTIAALLQIAVPDTQLGGRFLQEAFLRRLSFPSFDEEIEEPEPDPPPPPEPEPVVIFEEAAPQIEVVQPPPPKCWNYRGLLRRFRVAVGDRDGRVYPRTGRRAKLNHLVMTGEFGRPHTVVKLTFYGRPERKTSRRDGRTTIKAMATFPAFELGRGRARLTLKIPKLFKPSYVGILIHNGKRLSRARIQRLKRRAKRAGKSPRTVLKYRPVGRPSGAIARVRWAKHLHTRAPNRKPKPKPKLRGC